MQKTVQVVSDNDDIFKPDNAYIPQRVYFDHAVELLPSIWRLKPDHFWTMAISPEQKNMPVQGWKIHISALPDSALRILSNVIPLCVSHATEFKFASDPSILSKLLSKNCKRESGGKFITIYPRSQSVFTSLLAALHPLLIDEEGPYILSDRPYKDSRVLHYRYGGFQRILQKSVNGKAIHCIFDEQFSYIEDIRASRFVLPYFMTDVLQSDLVDDGEASVQEAANEPNAIFGGRFSIQKVLKFCNAGGVYRGRDEQTKKEAILKESRPYIGRSADGVDCIARLEKEFRILTKIGSAKIAPTAFDFFKEWEHFFLAQEFLDGISLRQFNVRSSALVHSSSSTEATKKWMHDVIKIAINFIEAIVKLHKFNIVFGDLSLNNIMVDPETLELKLIDFEAAVELGVDGPTNFFTPGFARPERIKKLTVDFCDDYYAIGCVLMALVVPNIIVAQIKPGYAETILEELRNDIGLPDALIQCILCLLSSSDISLPFWAGALANCDLSAVRPVSSAAMTISKDGSDSAQLVSRILQFNTKMMDVSQHLRVFPLGPDAEDALAINHGVLGVAYSWHKIAGTIPNELNEWVEANYSINGALPGLLNGLSGMAWALLELGHGKLARHALHAAGFHPQLFEQMSLGYGAAGFGLCNLFFYTKLNEPTYLNQAIRIADIICEHAVEHKGGLTWGALDDVNGAPVGYFEGSSGVALFLLYVHCITNHPRYLEVGERAMTFDMSHAKDSNGSLGFPRYSDGPSTILFPYLGYGTAGIATAALRYYAVTGKKNYEETVLRAKDTAAIKYAVSPDLFTGLSGLGNFLLDVHQLLGDESCLMLAHRVSDGVKLFEIRKEFGSCFPIPLRDKLCCDYAGGSSGIALFLHRLDNGGENFNFMLDGVLREAKMPVI